MVTPNTVLSGGLNKGLKLFAYYLPIKANEKLISVWLDKTLLKTLNLLVSHNFKAHVLPASFYSFYSNPW